MDERAFLERLRALPLHPGAGGLRDDTARLAGLVVTNDVSARDVQLPQTQFYEAKSYPTFTPVGPELVLLSADELKRFGDLRLRLSVNGDERQNALVDPDMLYRPLQALQSLTQFQELAPGDLVLTGTPAGTALSAPPKPLQRWASNCWMKRNTAPCRPWASSI